MRNYVGNVQGNLQIFVWHSCLPCCARVVKDTRSSVSVTYFDPKKIFLTGSFERNTSYFFSISKL